MSVRLVLVAPSADADPSSADRAGDLPDPAAVWPQRADGRTEWAAQLHDGLASPATTSDVARIASWLRVQAVGRETVVLTEPRFATYAGVWAAAADQAGLGPVELTDRASRTGSPVVAEAVAEPAKAVGPSRSTGPRRVLAESRLWAVDRAEATARLAVRTLQR